VVKHVELQVENMKNNIALAGLKRWVSFRLEIISSILVVIPTLFLCFWSQGRLPAAYIGAVLTYLFKIDKDLLSVLWMVNIVESRIISWERLQDLIKIP